MKKLKAYFWKEHEDAETGIAVIAHNSKEAKKIGSDWWGAEVGHDDYDWFINQRITWLKEAKLDGSESVGVIDDYKEGIKKGLYAWVDGEGECCEKCNEKLLIINQENGEPYSKRTCLWIKGLPNLQPTKIIKENIIQWVNGGSKKADGTPRSQAARASTFRDSKTKSKTFPGIAKAMAEQWGKHSHK